MAIKIKRTSDIVADGVKCVVYGGAGVGKTRLCATAPRPIIISAESGLLSLKDVDVDYVEIKTINDLASAYRQLKDSDDYDTICLDSLSEICEVLIENILPNHKDGRQAYAELSRTVLPILRKFRDIPSKNTVFTVKLRRYKDEDNDKVIEELLLPGNVLPEQVPYMVDELFCLRTDRKGVPLLQTSPDRTRFCKDRSGALEKEEKELNLTKLFAKMNAKTKEN